MATIFEISKALSEVLYSEELEDFDAPVKLITPDGKEYLVTGVSLETTEDTNEQIVWLTGAEE